MFTHPKQWNMSQWESNSSCKFGFVEFVPKKTLCQHIGTSALYVCLRRSFVPGHHLPCLVSSAIVREHGTSRRVDEIQPLVFKAFFEVRINDLFGISYLIQREKVLQLWPLKLLMFHVALTEGHRCSTESFTPTHAGSVWRSSAKFWRQNLVPVVSENHL